jgi:hypothetical protein
MASSLSQKASPLEHAGRYTHLAQRRRGDAAAFRPRGGHVHERFLQLGKAGGLVDLSELRVESSRC